MGRMNWLITSPGDGYGAQTVMFVFSMVLLTLPLAALLAASLFEDLRKHRSDECDFAYEPLALRSFRVTKATRFP